MLAFSGRVPDACLVHLSTRIVLLMQWSGLLHAVVDRVQEASSDNADNAVPVPGFVFFPSGAFVGS